jgi:ABC-2 type transport system ATP-binding protein
MTCDAVAILNKGQLVFQGKLDELLSEPLELDIRFQNPSPSWQDIAAKWGTVVGVNGDMLTVRVRTEDAIPDLIAALVSNGARLMSVVPKRFSLEDLFVQVIRDEPR